jgi:hypothetical protein
MFGLLDCHHALAWSLGLDQQAMHFEAAAGVFDPFHQPQAWRRSGSRNFFETKCGAQIADRQR